MKWSGLFTALITPFKGDKLDEAGLRHNIQRQIQAGVDGIVVLGTTGEAPTLSTEEQERIIVMAREEAGSLPLLVGTGSYSTKMTMEATKRAADLGADGALVVTPYYNKPTQQGLALHFQAVAECSPLPLILYNIAGRTQVNIEVSTLQSLAKIPTIVGIKECSGNLTQVSEIIRVIKQKRPDFSLLSGDDALTLPMMALGARGIISVVANLVPAQMKELVKACQRGDYEKARSLHYTLLPLFSATFVETNPIPIKEAMHLCGLPSGPPRLPLCPLSETYRIQLQKVLKSCAPFL